MLLRPGVLALVLACSACQSIADLSDPVRSAGEGEECMDSRNCREGLSCVDGRCGGATPDGDADGETDPDADPCEGVTCSEHGECGVFSGEPRCACDDGYHAEELECECVPDCGRRECGPNRCGGQCSPGCGDDERCNDSGVCECVPDCGERECDMDPICGTLSCGSCGDDERCNDSWVCECVPDCGERECDMDPICGTLSCGSCGDDERCNDSGMCEVPHCDGGLLDPSRGLCWQDPPPARGYDWDEAVIYCDSLDLGGHHPGSWHLPTISELRSLIRGCPETETVGECGVTDACLGGECWNDNCYGCSYLGGPGDDGAYWPVEFGGSLSWYWSSSSYAGVSSYAWGVGFLYGNVGDGGKSGLHYVRCVRGGP